MKLQDYCLERNISMNDLADATEVSADMLYKIDRGANVSVATINKIYEGTKKLFGVGLIAEQYLDIYPDR